jgi:hypothetical protein
LFDLEDRPWMQGKPAKFNPSGGYFPGALVSAAQIWSLSSVAGALGTMTVGPSHRFQTFPNQPAAAASQAMARHPPL